MRTVIAALALVIGAAPTEAQDLFLTNGRILDPVAETIQTGNLLIVNGRIAGRPEEAPSTFAGETLDLGARWVIPSLKDLHTHSVGNRAPGNIADAPGAEIIAQRLLYAGVTALLDLFADEDEILNLRDQLRTTPQMSADVYAAGPAFTATGGHPTQYRPSRTINTPEEGR